MYNDIKHCRAGSTRYKLNKWSEAYMPLNWRGIIRHKTRNIPPTTLSAMNKTSLQHILPQNV